MSDELKERLAKISYYASVPKELAYITTNITPQECKTILDYITDLEEHNNELIDKVSDRDELIVENLQLKRDRIGKAIEKIESVRIYGLRSGKTLIATLLNDILDILRGSDKE